MDRDDGSILDQPAAGDRDDRHIVYAEDGRWVYRASALGGCRTALVAARLGLPPVGGVPEAVRRAAADGWRWEEVVATEMALVRRQETVELAVSDDIFVRGHIDGLVVTDEGELMCRLVEVKTVSGEVGWRSLADALAAQPRWRLQIAAYAAGLGLHRVRLVVVDRRTGERTVLDGPAPDAAEVVERVREVEEIAASTSLPADADCGEPWCRYRYLHADDRTDATDMEDVAEAYFELSRQLAVVQKAKDAVRDRLVALGKGRYVTPSWHVTVSRYSSRRVDADALKRDGLYERYSKEIETTRVTVTRKKDGR